MFARPPIAWSGSAAPRPRKRFRETIHDVDWLRARYVDERLTLDQIASLARCSKPSVWRAMQKFGMERRAVADSMPRKRRPRQGVPRGGLSLDEYRALFDAQDGLCAACGQPETKVHRNGTVIRLAVDHDHETGAVRGLLCSRCNYSLGYARDDPEVLRQLIAYLERPRT